MSAARAALASGRPRLAASERPPVARSTSASRNGVRRAPAIPAAEAAMTAVATAFSTNRASSATAAGGGCTTSNAPGRPSARLARNVAAMSAAESAAALTRSPVCAVKNPGNSSVRNPMTVTPSVSRRSTVALRSRMDFAPAQTVTTLDLESSSRSADSSNAAPDARRWTPPIPPVASTGMPAPVHRQSAAATVVAPSKPRTMAQGRSRAETFGIPDRARNRARSSSSSPATGTPRTTAVTAGTAPRSRIAARMRRAAARVAGSGSPWAKTELSSATTARPSRRAAATSAWRWTFTNLSGVVELFRLLRHHQFTLARIGIEHGEHAHRLAREDVERLADAALHDDLVTVLEAKHDVRVFGVHVLFAQLLRRGRHLTGGEGRGESSAGNMRVQPPSGYVTTGRDPSNRFQAPDSRMAAVSAATRSISSSVV